MSDTWMVRAEGLGKKFSKSLAHSLRRGLKDTLGQLLGWRRRNSNLQTGEFWALEDVGFELERGRCLGIMGINGSGKTTLLRILQGIFPPDRGQVALRGQVGSLIAAGAGFSPLLTGRENIMVNAALLGMSRADLKKHFDNIVTFADIADFLDAPVKHYSSGMQVRLGFAIAAFARPDILLIDEVLAVGDMNFQKKCYEHLHRLRQDGTTIVFVSHAVGAIWALCDCGLFLDQGRVKVFGPVDDVIRAYKDRTAGNALDMKPDYGGEAGGTGDAVIHWTRVLSQVDGQPKTELAFREPFLLESQVEVRRSIRRPVFRYTLDAVHYKYIACLDSIEQRLHLEGLKPGTYLIRTLVPRQNLMPGSYSINSNVCQEGLGIHLFFRNGIAGFKILQPPQQLLYGDDNAVLYLDSSFSVNPA
jgi:lipopolysaccharide transport system ATP-binding protein